MRIEHYRCPHCGLRRVVESLGRVEYAICPRCHVPMVREYGD